MLTHRQALATLIVGGLPAALAGCGGSDPGRFPLHPAGGQVLLQGKPLPGVQVTFRPASADEEAPVPMARTDQEGRFRLSTFLPGSTVASEGAPAGDYRVAISTPARSDSIDFARKDAPKVAPDLLRGRYADPGSSGLRASIRPGPNTLEPFDLGARGKPAAPASQASRD
ncbi:hypothetical protein P12x_005764 [Tundrisphaera lichenicola]|uniref:hypothetical protein n=1 Tax=Tundrisphaera lichenicola TaxID=2029860 RepID=UPI003EB89A76